MKVGLSGKENTQNKKKDMKLSPKRKHRDSNPHIML